MSHAKILFHVVFVLKCALNRTHNDKGREGRDVQNINVKKRRKKEEIKK